MNTKWLDDLFYALYKDYGTRIVYTKIGKASVNYDTGERQDTKTSIEVPAVIAPVTIFQDYLDTLTKLGKPDSVDRAKTRFLVKKQDLGDIAIESADYIVSGDKRYMQLAADDLITMYVFSGVAVTNALPYRVLNLSANDQLGLSNGV